MISFLNLNIFVTLGCWSVWGILDKKALENSSHMGIMLRLYLMALWQAPLLWLYLALTKPGFILAPEVWMWTAFAAVFQVFSLAAYLVAMSITDASLVLSATAAYPVVTQFLAMMFLGERLSMPRTLGSLAIAIGVIGIGLSFNHSHRKLQGQQLFVLIACLVSATVGWGIWGIFDKKAINFGSPIEIWLAQCVWESLFVMIALALLRARQIKLEMLDRRAWLFTTLSAVALGVGRLTFLNCLKIADASYVIAITGCYPLFMYFLAIMFLKERFSKTRLAGIGLIVAGGTAVQLSL